MAPFSALARRAVADRFRNQWQTPQDVFNILLILGGDIVARALAQLAGHGPAPVTFSFGWVAYALAAVSSAVGENKLMPQAPDCQSRVINGRTGVSLDNSSWILGRIVRDYETWRHPAIRAKLVEVLHQRWQADKKNDPDAKMPIRAGLVVGIYQPRTDRAPCIPQRDLVYWSGFVTMAIQFGIAAIPLGLDHQTPDWSPMMITASGTALATLTGLLPQWRTEKWACRRRARETYILTRGNGAQHAIVILGNGSGLNLADLAAGPANLDTSADVWTRTALLALALLWLAFLVTASALKDSGWFFLGVGGLGTLQNLFAAGWARRPECFGVPLEYVGVVGEVKVMRALLAVEERYPGVGRSLRDEFFPQKLRPEEEKLWEEAERRAVGAGA